MLEEQEFQAFLKALGNRIRFLRKSKNMNMRDIIIASGYYDAQWRKYEMGSAMNIQSLMRVALTLDVSLADLFDGLAQWPRLSVEQISQRDASVQGIEQEPEAEPEHEEKEDDPLPSPPPKKRSSKSPAKSVATAAKPLTSGKRSTGASSSQRKRKV